ncbi:hypothetical protein C8R48DRAFT_779239 [Suillus tomentosus]|nr:hypothetical protein C8R48DRAFT_779239 [Suillus tomentosus]
MSCSQRRRYSNDSHPSDRNDAAEILLGYASTTNPATDDPFDGLRSLHDVSGDCTPGAGNLGYRDASDSDVDHAIKLVEKIEEEHYQQLKRDIDDWNARVEDDTKFLPLSKRKWPCSDGGDIQASPCCFGHNLTNSPQRVPSMNPTTPRKRRKLQAPFEFNPHTKSPSKTLVEALSGIETALERHNVMENLNTK